MCVVFLFLSSFCEVFCDHGGVYCSDVDVYVLFYNGVWVCVKVCGISFVIECDLFLESGNGSGLMFC